MRGVVVNPWECPAGLNTPHRLVHLSNLPPECCWSDLRPIFANRNVELHHLFDHQVLVQFFDPYEARAFIDEMPQKLMISGYPISVSLSPLTHLIYPSEAPGRTGQSRVICIQVVRLRVYLGIHDIYDECSRYGTVEKIICFEKTGKFALVQMSTVFEASLVLANLSNAPRHIPAFQMRIQYSKNQDISIKFNNSKSFDFTAPDAKKQFAQLRVTAAGEVPFFTPEHSNEIPPIFDAWRPIHFDSSSQSLLCVTGFEEGKIVTDAFHNLFSQYGPIKRIKIPYKNRKTCFILMANGFYARIAAVFLQGCPFDGRRLQIDFSAHSELGTPTDHGSDQLYREYDSDTEDLTLEDYDTMWFPSEYVNVKPSSVSIADLSLPSSVILHAEENILQFPTTSDSVLFIAQNNFTRVNGNVLNLRFIKPIQ